MTLLCDQNKTFRKEQTYTLVYWTVDFRVSISAQRKKIICSSPELATRKIKLKISLLQLVLFLLVTSIPFFQNKLWIEYKVLE